MAGTATAVSGAVASKQMSRHQEAAQASAEQQQMAAMQQQMVDLQAQQAAAAVPAQPAAAAMDPLTEKLTQLATLHAQGILTDEEFATAKARALGI